MSSESTISSPGKDSTRSISAKGCQVGGKIAKALSGHAVTAAAAVTGAATVAAGSTFPVDPKLLEAAVETLLQECAHW